MIRSKKWNTYLGTYPGNGVLQSTYLTKKIHLEISIRKEMNTEETRVNDDNMKKCEK